MRIFLSSCLLILLLVTVGSCKKRCQDPSNPECENYNPCYGKAPVTASMIMDQSLSAFWFEEDFYETGDTLFPLLFSYIRFRNNASNTQATWILGKDTVIGQQVERHFKSLPYGAYPVTLIVKGSADSSCFPKDDGIDTITKYVYTIPICQLNVFGTFKVLFDGQTDSTLVRIKAKKQNNLLDSCVETNLIELTNYDGKGSVRWDYSYFSFNHLYAGDPIKDNNLLQVHTSIDTKKNMITVSGEGGWFIKGTRFKGRRISN